MKDVFELIPKHKSDLSGIESLKTIDISEAEPILGKLLEWIQDINWPVAWPLIKVLPRFHSSMVPHINFILKSDDDIWKCWVLLLVKSFPPETVKLLAGDIRRVADSPTPGEIMEGADEYAAEVIEFFRL